MLARPRQSCINLACADGISQPNGTFTIGTGGGSPTAQLVKAPTGTSRFLFSQDPDNPTNGDYKLEHTNTNTFTLDAYVGGSYARVAEVDTAAKLSLYNGSTTYSRAGDSVSVTAGLENTAGAGLTYDFVKPDAGTIFWRYFVTDFTAANLRWNVTWGANEDFRWERRDITGAIVDTPLLLSWTDGTADFAQTVLAKRFGSQGTALVAGDFALSAGWGTTASVAVDANSDDTRGQITVTSSGTGQGANPTITLTFKDGTFTSVPFAIVVRSDHANQPTVTIDYTLTATTLTITFNGTPVAAETYDIAWQVMK